MADSAGAGAPARRSPTRWRRRRYAPDAYRDALAGAERLAGDGLHDGAEVSCRPTGMLFGLQSSLHPFITHPTYRSIAELPLGGAGGAASRARVRDALLAEEPATANPIARSLMARWGQIFPLGDPPDYEPRGRRRASRPQRRVEGRAPEAVVLDWLLERDGKALLFAPLASYVDGDHEAIREMMTHPRTVLGLSDGGAHCGLICDASMPTYMLTHWVRDRTRGARLPIEHAVHLQTGRTAATLRVHRPRRDRSRVSGPTSTSSTSTGCACTTPEMVFDLPAGGRRLVQRADGYRATDRGRRGHLRGRRADRRPPRPPRPLRPERPSLIRR